MLIMPPIKIYIKSYDATRSHASDQSPGKEERELRVTQLTDVIANSTLDSLMISEFTGS